ncbi:MAG: DUF2164 domain-containing protein [Pseudomonadota bacterium]
MSLVQFSPSEKEAIVEKVKLYFNEKLDQQIGGFDAEFLIDFFAEEIGAHFYNRGLQDAHTLVASQVEELADAIYQLEKPT